MPINLFCQEQMLLNEVFRFDAGLLDFGTKCEAITRACLQLRHVCDMYVSQGGNKAQESQQDVRAVETRVMPCCLWLALSREVVWGAYQVTKGK
jgi:hypothetical protein